MIRVMVWNENIHEKEGLLDEFYPEGLHNVIADIVKELGEKVEVRTATLDQPEQGLPVEVLNNTELSELGCIYIDSALEAKRAQAPK